MTRDEIYDHLARVYLDKRESVVDVKEIPLKRPRVANVINVVITAFILVSVVYGFTAFLARRHDDLRSRVIYSLSNSPVRLNYMQADGNPQIKDLSFPISDIDVSGFRRLNVALKASEGGNPGVVKLVLVNARNERASYYFQGITPRWQNFSVPFDKLDIADWSSLKEISFVIEAWNAQRATGTVLIDNISFSN